MIVNFKLCKVSFEFFYFKVLPSHFIALMYSKCCPKTVHSCCHLNKSTRLKGYFMTYIYLFIFKYRLTDAS